MVTAVEGVSEAAAEIKGFLAITKKDVGCSGVRIRPKQEQPFASVSHGDDAEIARIGGIHDSPAAGSAVAFEGQGVGAGDNGTDGGVCGLDAAND